MTNILTLKWEAEKEAYSYFNDNVRPLIMKNNGEVDLLKNKLWDNDIDAFRHAYVSGVYTMEYGAGIAEALGKFQEHFPGGGSSSNNTEASKNMDFWNNAVGRMLGKKAKSRAELARFLKKSLDSAELIKDLSDSRKYDEDFEFNFDPKKPVVVIQENKSGRNELFLDIHKGTMMDRPTFVSLINSGEYPGYQVSDIHNLATPMSKSDTIVSNNLG